MASSHRQRIREYRSRTIFKRGDSHAITIPKELDNPDIDFPYELGAELRVELREPEGVLVLVPKGDPR